jgi:hypothetical protein
MTIRGAFAGPRWTMKHFKVEALAAAQLKDLGCVTWEIELYLDNDQTCDGADD